MPIFVIGITSVKYNSRQSQISEFDTLIGSKVPLEAEWIGSRSVSTSLDILLLAGHADSQGVGAGTSGEAVDLYGALPMHPLMSDELFWNLKLINRIEKFGKRKGLKINHYDPLIRNINDANDPKTNWTVGSKHASQGGYSLEIHFDSYGNHGIGSGLIPPISKNLNTLDESLAHTFGKFPLFYRGGLGAPRRQIRVLEIGKLEGYLEARLRDLNTREQTLNLIAKRIVKAIVVGVKKNQYLNPLPDKQNTFLPAIYL